MTTTTFTATHLVTLTYADGSTSEMLVQANDSGRLSTKADVASNYGGEYRIGDQGELLYRGGSPTRMRCIPACTGGSVKALEQAVSFEIPSTVGDVRRG